MLGQYYEAKTDTYSGSIFRNEMEYHMFTRTVRGFCDKCDLSPPERTNMEGFMLPGHRFHSKANEFQDIYFNDWQSNELFTDMTPFNILQCKLFKIDKEGKYLKEILSQDELLRITAGTYGETNAFQNFVTCKEADFGIKVETGYWIETKLNGYPETFKMSMEPFEPSFLPTQIVTKVWYGIKTLIRFACENENKEQCYNNLKVFQKCQKIQLCASVLDNLPSYKTWIGPASYKDNCPIFGPQVMQLRAAYNQFQVYIGDTLTQNNGKGYAIFPQMVKLAIYPDCKYDIGTKEVLLFEGRSKITRYYKYNTPCGISLTILAQLYKSILDAQNIVAQPNSAEEAILMSNFQANLAEFRSRLTYMLYVKDNHNRIQCYLDGIDKMIRHYWNSNLSPKKIGIELQAIRARNEFNFLSQLNARGVTVLPNQLSPTEECVILELGNFHLSRNLEYWESTITFFFNLIEGEIEGRKRSFYINERDVMERSVFVKQYKGINVICVNLFGEYLSRNQIPKPRCILNGTTVPWEFNLPCELLALTCPAYWTQQCSPVYKNWCCVNCGGLIRYESTTSSTVCFCGKIFLYDIGLVCPHQQYEVPLLYPAMTFMNQAPKSQLNILLLGEVGCGKSTFIYSLSKYLCSNKTTDMTTELEHENEEAVLKHLFGRGDKRKCTSYVIPNGETRFLKIIKTPGFLPSFTDCVPILTWVLNYASQSSLIHALCIVVKCDVAGFSTGFRTMFNTLLRVLLPNKLQNVVFLLTHLDCSLVGFNASSLLNISEVELSPNILSGERMFTFNNIKLVSLMNSARMAGTRIDLNEHPEFWQHDVIECNRLIYQVSQMEPFDPAINLRYEEKYINKMEEIVVLL